MSDLGFDRPGRPALDALVTVLAAPVVLVSEASGQVRAGGAQGLYVGDRRACSRLEIAPDPRPAGVTLDGAARAVFDGRAGGVTVTRTRQITAGGATERLVLRAGDRAAGLDLVLHAAADLAPTPVVKAGEAPPPPAPTAVPGGVGWERDGARARLTADPAPARTALDGTGATLTWPVHLPPRGTWTVTLDVSADVRTAFPAAPSRPWPGPVPSDPRLTALRERGLADLDGLLLADPEHPQDRFAAAGSPWFCTLFGRDALWTARLLLPLGPGTATALAGGTLRVLARRQGRRHDARAEEEPGKILHEVRAGGLRADGLDLPPVYYGTIDATPLWCCLLHDAWRAGLPDDEVAALLPHLEAALAWIRGAAGRTGFLAYAGSAGGGLANQGWKDSADGVRWADGTVAARPLALCEVQGYAHEAALGGAALLDAFGRPGGDGLRRWARDLAERFRAAFWIDDPDDPDGRYPAVALDGTGRPVTGAASNMGHLLPTGLLDAAEARAVAERLARPDLDCGRGLRTLAATSGGYAPLGYHVGTVWPHDTAVAALGLAAAGHAGVARSLAEGLVAAAAAFDDRLPELYGVVDGRVVPYPTACRPQAWAAAAGVAVADLLSGKPPPAWAAAP